MTSRGRARTALAELNQQQRAQTTAIVKPNRSPYAVATRSTSAALRLQSVEAIAIIARKRDVISLDSEDLDTPGDSSRDAIDLSDSSESVIDISSSDDDDGEDSASSEDEDGESVLSEDESHGHKESSSSTSSSKLLAGDVAKLITGGDQTKLKADDCRIYLRNHGLRVTGTKAVLIDRIKQHIELKRGGSRGYERSTFTINCTGDVCKGDVVMFSQKVHQKFPVTTRRGTRAGSRTVAGRIVKESYGAQRQQHTFTVEVLWSTGCRALAPMKQLLVKGRNLYKRRTFRQRWADEGERQRSLDEKHERGDAARQVRAMKHLRFKGHAVGRFGLEGPSREQLANPYTNMLASKENRYFSSKTEVFQSAFAAVNSHQHVGYRDNSWVSTGADSRPLGKNRQWPVSGNGKIQRAASAGASSAVKSTTGRTTQRWPPVSNNEVPRTGFPCPTASCPNLGSGKCSNGVCFYCCKKKGGACRNPRH